MSEFLGARISLISKSDIRYSGVLHEINSEESTVSLENVVSYGTEGRRGQPDEEIPPADQIYEYIVFRGSDVKDLRIEGTPAANAAPVPNDPAILGARPRPTNTSNNAPPPPYAQGAPQGPPQQAGRGGPGMPPGPGGPSGPGGPGGPGFMPNMPMPPNSGGWGPNGPSPRNFPYPPPPGWYPPQGPGFGPNGAGGPGAGGPPGPNGPQWNNGYYPPGPRQPPFMPGPPGPPGPQPQPQHGLPPQQQQAPEVRASPAAGSEKQKGPIPGPPEPEPKSLSQPPVQQAPSGSTKRAAGVSPSPATKNEAVELPTGPRNVTRITPIVPLPDGLVKKATSQTTVTQVVDVSNAATVRDATLAAKAAVAVAMAKLEGPGGSAAPAPGGTSAPAPAQSGSVTMMDNLTRKVNEMRVNASQTNVASNGSHYNSGGGGGGNYSRGRGNRNGYGGPPRTARVEVPDTPFDFASANAKFKKDEVVKEAGAGDVSDTVDPTAVSELSTGEKGATDSSTGDAAAYSKTRSFFDNISSEAKDRAASNGQRVGGREWRGEEQRKNMETFGQGSVDGGFRGFRGRGRGRGRGGYNRGRGTANGYRRYNTGNSEQQQ